MFCCCPVLSSHTVIVGFHLHVWWRIFLYSIMRGDYDIQLASGATASEMKLVPHVSRVGLDTLHVLGRVVFAYVFVVNTCWCICVLGDWLKLMNLMLVHSLMKIIYVHAYLWKINYLMHV